MLCLNNQRIYTSVTTDTYLILIYISESFMGVLHSALLTTPPQRSGDYSKGQQPKGSEACTAHMCGLQRLKKLRGELQEHGNWECQRHRK